MCVEGCTRNLSNQRGGLCHLLIFVFWLWIHSLCLFSENRSGPFKYFSFASWHWRFASGGHWKDSARRKMDLLPDSVMPTQQVPAAHTAFSSTKCLKYSQILLQYMVITTTQWPAAYPCTLSLDSLVVVCLWLLKHSQLLHFPVLAMHGSQQCLVASNFPWHPLSGSFVAECLWWITFPWTAFIGTLDGAFLASRFPGSRFPSSSTIRWVTTIFSPKGTGSQLLVWERGQIRNFLGCCFLAMLMLSTTFLNIWIIFIKLF